MSEQEKIRVYRLTYDGGGPACVMESFKDLCQMLEVELMEGDDWASGARWEVEIDFMTRAELDALPEFDGF